ncbi:MAG TPA: hypothetical protein VHA78_00115 [Candidatus Peribacteraceae bacterium]|nr:hypothetical protein [Candidatus Peribacteraceae bacterium]
MPSVIKDLLASLSLLKKSATTGRASLGKMVDQSTVMLMIAIGSLILVLALLILFHENANATKGYQLRTLERQRSQLLLNEEVQNMQIAQEQSLENLQQDPKIQAMPDSKNIQYVNDPSPPDGTR